MSCAAAEITLEDAMSTLSKTLVRVNYKGRVIQYSSVLTLGEGAFGKVFKGWDSVSTFSNKYRGCC